MDPETQFAEWFAEAEHLDSEEAARCFVATVSAQGQPSVRIVYHRPGSTGRVRFFTNYESRKGVEIAQDSRVAVAFHWPKLERQVRLEGRVHRVSAADSDAYFLARPLDSQLASALSPQSRPITSIQALRALHAEKQSAGVPVQRPAHWGGFELQPEVIEFWSAGYARLHERTLWRRHGQGWQSEALAP
jgi:pyridoxamine 5'-phosphate oxidase